MKTEYIEQPDLDWIEKSHGLNVGELLDFIEKHNLPRDAKVLYHRIEDVYFSRHNWHVAKVKGEFYHNAIQHNKNIAPGGKFWDKEQYPDLKIEDMKPYTEDQLNEFKEEYILAHCQINYDDKNLYITAHY